MEKLILVAVYGIEITKYLLGVRIVFEERLRNKYIFAIMGGACALFFWFGKGDAETNCIMLVAMVMLAVGFALQGSLWKRFSKVMTMFILLESIDGMLTNLTEYLEKWTQDSDTTIYMGYFIESLWGLFVLLVLAAILRFAERRKVQLLTGNGGLAIIAMNGIAIAFTVAGLNVTKHYVTNNRFQIFANVATTVAYMSLALLCWLLVYMGKMNSRMKKIVVMEQELKRAQGTYYRSLLKKEEQTRKFRHDVSNHLTYLKHLAETSDMERVRDYLNKMSGQLEYIQNISYVTGNEILDVMLSEKLSAVDFTVETEIKGKFTKNPDIDEMDMCTVFSNLIQNALEELSRMKEGERWLKIHIKSGNDFVKFQIQNRAQGHKKIMKNGLPKSEKENEVEHGIGLTNVKEVVEKYEGVLKIDSTREMFSVSAILPTKGTV